MTGMNPSEHGIYGFMEMNLDNAMLIDSYGFDLNEHPYIYDIGKKLKEFF